MKRTIIKIHEQRCNGCGLCVKGCHEGALQLINGKAVLVSELFCDGLGACIGDCPVNAITLEEREAEAYDEVAVMQQLVPKGEAVIKAHLKHLREHGEQKAFRQGLDYLQQHQIDIDVREFIRPQQPAPDCGCPGAMAREINRPAPAITGVAAPAVSNPVTNSELRQFPVQLHLLNPYAPFLQGADLLLAADCTAFASGEFHSRFLKGRKLAIACPKLDINIQGYIDKLAVLIAESKIKSLTVLVMEVPCCGGLVRIAEAAREQPAGLPVRKIVLSIDGTVKSETWI